MTYWIALALFGVAVMIPEIVLRDWWLFRQDEVETIALIVLVGALFVTYLLTDRRLRVMIGQYRTLQQETRDSAKDLAKAYGHIGETNRKIEIVLGFHSRMMAHVYPTYAAVCSDLAGRIAMLVRTSCHVCVTDCATRTTVGASGDMPALSADAHAALCATRPPATVPHGSGPPSRLMAARRIDRDLVIAALCPGDNGSVPHDNIDDELVRMAVAIAATELAHGTIRTGEGAGKGTTVNH